LLGDPVPVPQTCTHTDGFVAVEDADTSLTNVLDSGIVRIGLSRVGGGFPLLYANETTDQGEFVVTLDLEGGGELDGYEIASAKEAVRRMGVQYGVALVPEFDVLPGPPFFAALEGALTDNIVDVAWTQIGVNNAREEVIDYTCPTFITTYRIVAGASVGSAVPVVTDGNTIKVACVAIFCTYDVPAPFETVDVGLSNTDYVALLTNTTDEYDYIVRAVDQSVFFFEDECPTCEFVEIDPVGSSSLAPATRQGPPATESPTPSPSVSMSPTMDSSVCGSGQGVVTAAVMGALAAGVAAL
jgi:ABC-type amino acid transport substrate-binding protein